MQPNERDSTVAVVHGCFPEGGAVEVTKAHDQPGCARAREHGRLILRMLQKFALNNLA